MSYRQFTSEIFITAIRGEFPPLTVINALIVGLGVGAVAGAVYAYSIAYIPIIYFNLVMGGTLRRALGFVPAYAFMHERERSHQCVGDGWRRDDCDGSLLLSALGCLAGRHFASSWFPLGLLLAHPRAVVELLKLVNETGIWSMSKGQSPVSGIALDVVRLVEAAGIFACAWLVAVAHAQAKRLSAKRAQPGAPSAPRFAGYKPVTPTTCAADLKRATGPTWMRKAHNTKEPIAGSPFSITPVRSVASFTRSAPKILSSARTSAGT